MGCYYHDSREGVASCIDCGKILCSECASKINPPSCPECTQAYVSKIKGEMMKNIAISVVLMFLGIAMCTGSSTNPLLGALLAGIPYGWRILTNITPAMFVWMPLIGWVVYFGVKFVLAYIILSGLLLYQSSYFNGLPRLKKQISSFRFSLPCSCGRHRMVY